MISQHNIVVCIRKFVTDPGVSGETRPGRRLCLAARTLTYHGTRSFACYRRGITFTGTESERSGTAMKTVTMYILLVSLAVVMGCGGDNSVAPRPEQDFPPRAVETFEAQTLTAERERCDTEACRNVGTLWEIYGKSLGHMLIYGRLMIYDIWEIYGNISCIWLVVTGTWIL